MSILNDAELDIDESEPFFSKRDTVVERLKERLLLKYGAMISEGDVAFAMDVKRSELTDDQWSLLKLQFREIVKSQGFFITSRGREDNLYILQPHEMPMYNDRKNKATYRNLKQRTRALHMIDQSLLSEEHQKKLEFEIFRNASFELQMADGVKKRCRY